MYYQRYQLFCLIYFSLCQHHKKVWYTFEVEITWWSTAWTFILGFMLSCCKVLWESWWLLQKKKFIFFELVRKQFWWWGFFFSFSQPTKTADSHFYKTCFHMITMLNWNDIFYVLIRSYCIRFVRLSWISQVFSHLNCQNKPNTLLNFFLCTWLIFCEKQIS